MTIPLDVVDWKVYSSYDDALVAVQNGEVKYALMGNTEQLWYQRAGRRWRDRDRKLPERDHGKLLLLPYGWTDRVGK